LSDLGKGKKGRILKNKRNSVNGRDGKTLSWEALGPSPKREGRPIKKKRREKIREGAVRRSPTSRVGRMTSLEPIAHDRNHNNDQTQELTHNPRKKKD